MRCDHAAERRQVTFSTVSTAPGFMRLAPAGTMLSMSNAGCFDGPYGQATAMMSSVAIGIASHGPRPPRHAGRIIGLRVWGARMFAESRQPTGRLRCTTIRACRSEYAQGELTRFTPRLIARLPHRTGRRALTPLPRPPSASSRRRRRQISNSAGGKARMPQPHGKRRPESPR